jgi:hypothetical protein
MTTFAPNPTQEDRLRELDQRKQRAWAQYRKTLHELTGKEYEEAEHRCWERLQRKLGGLERERAELLEGERPSPDPAGAGAAG